MIAPGYGVCITIFKFGCTVSIPDRIFAFNCVIDWTVS